MRRLAPLLFVLLLTGCDTVQSVQNFVSPPPPPPDPKTLMPALEQRIETLIADARVQIDPKATPLAVDPELCDVARKRAADMAEKNYFDHTAPNGDTSATILMNEDARFQGLLGENMAAQHYAKGQPIDVDAFAHRIVDSWLLSPPHKDNLAYAKYSRTGVGAAVNGDTIYVTQLFSSDLGLGPHVDGAPAPVVTPLPSAKASEAPPTPAQEPILRGSEGTQ